MCRVQCQLLSKTLVFEGLITFKELIKCEGIIKNGYGKRIKMSRSPFKLLSKFVFTCSLGPHIFEKPFLKHTTDLNYQVQFNQNNCN